MKMASNCVRLAVVAAAVTMVAGAGVPTEQDKISKFHPDDFVYPLGGPEADAVDDAGLQSRMVTVRDLSTLEGQGLSMVLVNLEACAINFAHSHPRAAQIVYVLEGEMRVGFVEEDGGDGPVVNDLGEGDVMILPQGLIHYEQNLGCESSTFIGALNHEDPGTVKIVESFFELPTEAVKAQINFDDAEINKFKDALPLAPKLAREECLKACADV